MISQSNPYPFFQLVETTHQAELALSVLSCFGSDQEKRVLRPQARRLQREFLSSNGHCNLTESVNGLLARYLAKYGDFSDQLTIFLGKSVQLGQRVA